MNLTKEDVLFVAAVVAGALGLLALVVASGAI